MSEIKRVQDTDLEKETDESLMVMYTREKVRAKFAETNLAVLAVEMRKRGGLRTSEGFFTESYRSMSRMNQADLVSLVRKLGGTDADIEACKKPSREPAGWRYAKETK